MHVFQLWWVFFFLKPQLLMSMHKETSLDFGHREMKLSKECFPPPPPLKMVPSSSGIFFLVFQKGRQCFWPRPPCFLFPKARPFK